MKVFLSWSGETSKQVAVVLRNWLPSVLQNIEPWMSSEDLEKGARWSSDIAKELAATKAGIVCVTSDNREAPWLNFESGALSKTVEKEMVCTYLFGLKPSDVIGPLTQFQASVSNKEDTQRLLNTLNKALSPKSLSEGKLSEAFQMWWPQLEKNLGAISSAFPSGKVTRSNNEMIEELLNLARNQDRSIQRIETFLQSGSLFGSDYGPKYPVISNLENLRRLMVDPANISNANSRSFIVAGNHDVAGDETDSESDPEPESPPETGG